MRPPADWDLGLWSVVLSAVCTAGCAGLELPGAVPWQAGFEEPFALTPPELAPSAAPAEAGRVAACRGQTALLALAVRARRDLNGLSVYAEDLVHEKQPEMKIPASGINVRVVKWWLQAGSPESVLPGDPILVPELLLKDDAERLVGPQPDVRLEGIPVTDIAAGITRHFWVTIQVPPFVSPGLYQGRLLVKPAGQAGRYVAIAVEVWPFELATADKMYILFYRRPTTPANRTLVALELEDMREHGVTAATCYDQPETLIEALRLRYEMGLRTPTPVISDGSVDLIRQVEATCRTHGWSPVWWYGRDAPQDSPQHFDENVRLFQAVRQAGGTSVVITPPAYVKRLGALLDVAVMSVVGAGHSKPWTPFDPTMAEYIKGLREGTIAKSHRYELYHWHPLVEDPRINRLLAGLYLYYSQLDGVFPYAYMVPDAPYAFDETTAPKPSRACNLAYPSVRGPIGTVQWEAFREGVYDLRYLRTLQGLIEQVRARPAASVPAAESAAGRPLDPATATAEAEAFLKSLAQRITADYYTTYRSMEPRDFSAIRQQAADHCQRLYRLLRPAPPAAEARGRPDRPAAATNR